MLTLATAFEREIDAGAPLPEVYPTLTRAGIKFRRSQVVMIAGQPGCRKSTFAMNLAAGMNVPTLYFSADTDDYTVSLRLAAAQSGSPVNQIEEETKDPSAKGYYLDLLAEPNNLLWSFEPEPTLDRMDLQLQATMELFGTAPSLIVVDNLVNVTLDSQDEWGGMRKIMKLFGYWARTTHACVMVLHHCQESAEFKPDRPPPRRAIQGKLSQYPSLILTLACEGELMKVACVKNRHGKAYPDASVWDTLRIDPPRMRVTDWRDAA